MSKVKELKIRNLFKTPEIIYNSSNVAYNTILLSFICLGPAVRAFRAKTRLTVHCSFAICEMGKSETIDKMNMFLSNFYELFVGDT